MDTASVYLRLRPPQAGAAAAERFITVEPPASDSQSTAPTHIVLTPPNDRRRAVEKFAFTQVFEEGATQLDVFHCTNLVPLIEGVLAPHGGDGTDALLATLGVTGSGKSHTILGSRTQRGLTQLSLDVLFRSIGKGIVDIDTNSTLEASIKASDGSEANISSASIFIDTVYGDTAEQPPRPSPQAQTPLVVRPHDSFVQPEAPSSDVFRPELYRPTEKSDPRLASPKSVRIVRKEDYTASSPFTPERFRDDGSAFPHGNIQSTIGNRQALRMRAANLKSPVKSPSKHYMGVTASARQKKRYAKTSPRKEYQPTNPAAPRRLLPRPPALAPAPDISTVSVPSDPAAEYAVLISMYEVYNDRIFDLLTPPAKSAATKVYRRRPLIFRSTDLAPDRKVVAGLRKILCSDLDQALMVLEAGLHERRVAGTGTNSVSSRSHGFFSIEVKKRPRSSGKRYEYPWGGSTLTIVDLAGSERARDARTAGATLAEAGKINESLMYLGQCLQMQSDVGSSSKPSVVPFRQCKLTELLFSNSFPSTMTQSQSIRRNPQKAVMIVTADPHGDFNATSQILRYSALAREVTVPRVPSITEAILQESAARGRASGQSTCRTSGNKQSYFSPNLTSSQQRQRTSVFTAGPLGPNLRRTVTPASTISSEDRNAMLEIAGLVEETNDLRRTLAREHEARVAAEAHMLSIEDKLVELEQAIREDCVAEFEQRLAVELARWKTGMQMALERGEEHWDRKMEVFERGLGLQADATEVIGDRGLEDKENLLIENLEEENARLRREVTILKRELVGRSPSKRVPLAERDNGPKLAMRPRHVSQNENALPENLQRRLESLSLREGQDDLRRVASVNHTQAIGKRMSDGAGSPVKRITSRKLTARRWEGGVDDGDDGF
ncbi:hypothetical protein VPNG_07957 [Cytospora leucostoma]|uniref:Kinesin-like protein n=1 Tax=Cytospora leucostoma TaxID=1230097 RepID=A0A423WB43_9PEZI|nr:hypothetical protein VPNG_07957 [Cytospora leucostoma]